MDRPWPLASIVLKTLDRVFFGKLILRKTRNVLSTHSSWLWLYPAHLAAGQSRHCPAGTLAMRYTHLCSVILHDNDQGLHTLCHSLKEHFLWTPTRAVLLTWHLEIYADKTEDVTLVGVSVILSQDSWLHLGEMASARLLFCKLGLLKEDFTGRALNPCDDLSCLVQPLSTRFSKHSCQVVMIAIPLLLLNLFCGKEEPFLLLSYFFFPVSVWTKVFLRENKELAHRKCIAHGIRPLFSVAWNLSSEILGDPNKMWNSIPYKILYSQIENKLATGAWIDRPLEWRSSEPR